MMTKEARVSSASVRAQLRALLVPVVAGLGSDLEDVEVSMAGRRRVVRLVVDRDGGVDLDAIAELSRVVSAALDERTGPTGVPVLGDSAYVLEVSSPGVDRPLVAPRHWRRAAGRLVRVRSASDGEIVGRVLAADEDGVLLSADGAPQRYAFADLGRGRVEVEFHPPGGEEGS